MSTALSSTSAATAPRVLRTWAELRRSREDLASILAFRRSGLAPATRRRLGYAAVVVVALTVAAAVVPAYAAGPDRPHAGAVLAVFPSLCLAFLAFAVVSAIASAGGREVIPREQAVALPVSTTTDHFGALLLAPLNIAWLAEAWALLGSLGYALGPGRVWAYQLPVLAWILVATALAQVVGWLSEGVRRGPRGQLVHRTVVGVVLVAAGVLVVTGWITPVLDHAPTRFLMTLALKGQQGEYVGWATGVVVLLLVAFTAALGGALPARWALHRPMREELRLEGGRYAARASTRTDLGMMVRLDRAAIWRSVPLRRGMTVLMVMPGGVALAGGLEWQMLTIMPGLVAAGGALLFGVNTWCLDARGALWRDSLPLSPVVAFTARALVLTEVLLASACVTLVLCVIRAGTPTAPDVVALACATVVVIVQVVAASMRWSIRRPYAVDLRSARATPAPPVVMAGYSARLALSTTFSGLLFSGFAQAQVLTSAEAVRFCLVAAVVMVTWSGLRLGLAARAWSDPGVRSRVIATVAG